MMRQALVGLILLALGGCAAETATDPLDPDDGSTVDDDRLPPPPETGQAFHLSFDGSNDRVLVPWHESFPTEVFTAVARIRLAAPPNGRAAIIARGEDDNSFNLSWQLYVGRGGELEAMLEASNEDNYCYPNNECVPFGNCVSGDRFVADGAWHLVAVTRDTSGTLVFYIDGEERARCEGTGIPSRNNRQFLSFGATHGTIGPPPGGIEPPTWFFPGPRHVEQESVRVGDRGPAAGRHRPDFAGTGRLLEPQRGGGPGSVRPLIGMESRLPRR